MSLIDQFREQFPTIVNAIVGTGYDLRFDEAGARIGVGATVLVTVKRAGRGFSLCWLVDRGILNGCGARGYSRFIPDSGTRNSEFLQEFRRRVSLANPATLREARDHTGAHSWRAKKRLRHELAASAY